MPVNGYCDFLHKQYSLFSAKVMKNVRTAKGFTTKNINYADCIRKTLFEPTIPNHSLSTLYITAKQFGQDCKVNWANLQTNLAQITQQIRPIYKSF